MVTLRRILTVATMVLALGACSSTDVLPIGSEEVVRLSLVEEGGDLNRAGYTGLTPSGEITRDRSFRLDQSFFDNEQQGKVMSDGTRWVQTSRRTDDGIRIYQVFNQTGMPQRLVAVESPIDSFGNFVLVQKDEVLYVLTME